MYVKIRRLIDSFSLVAEIGWLASVGTKAQTGIYGLFQSRCRDWVVGEDPSLLLNVGIVVSFSLVAEIGWLAS